MRSRTETTTNRKTYEIQLYGGPKDGERIRADHLPAEIVIPYPGSRAEYRLSWTLGNKVEVNALGHVIYRLRKPDVPGLTADVS